MIGSLENLYNSIEDLNETYIQPSQNKDIFLSPKSPAGAAVSPVTLLALDDAPAPEKKDGRAFYGCNNCCSGYVTDEPRAVCPNCSLIMSAGMRYVAPQENDRGVIKEGGFVEGVVTYMIMDDLEVKPMSTISSIALLNKFNVKDLSALKEKAVDLGMNEAWKLLKASLESKTVLTNVFLDNQEE